MRNTDRSRYDPVWRQIQRPPNPRPPRTASRQRRRRGTGQRDRHGDKNADQRPATPHSPTQVVIAAHQSSSNHMLTGSQPKVQLCALDGAEKHCVVVMTSHPNLGECSSGDWSPRDPRCCAVRLERRVPLYACGTLHHCPVPRTGRTLRSCPDYRNTDCRRAAVRTHTPWPSVPALKSLSVPGAGVAPGAPFSPSAPFAPA